MTAHQITDSTAPVEPWATIDDVAAHLQLNRRTIYNLMDAGLPYSLVGKRRRFKLSEVDRFIAEQQCVCIATPADEWVAA